jgi:hypothetical protein
MFRSLAVAAALLSVAAPTLSEAQTWRPTGKWTVDDAETGCVLSRTFDANGIGLTFTYRPWLSANGAAITLSSTDPHFPKRGSVVATLLPSAQTFNLDAPGGLTMVKTEGLVLNSGPDFGEALATANGLRIAVAGRLIELTTGPFAAAIAALKTCRNNRLQAYGLDPESVVAVPAEQSMSIYSASDYPVDAVREAAQGRAVVAVSFGADGKPVGCKVVESTGNKFLDLASCRPGFRLKLEPVSDPFRTRWVLLPVRWSLPGRNPRS